MEIFLSHKVESFIPYLESRLVQTEAVEKIKKGEIIQNERTGMCTASFWLDPLDEDKILTTPKKEIDILLQFVDIPALHSFDSKSESFFYALAEAEHLELYESKTIKKIIDYKWPLIFEYTVKKMFIPFLIYMVTCVVYMSGVYINKNDSTSWILINFAF